MVEKLHLTTYSKCYLLTLSQVILALNQLLPTITWHSRQACRKSQLFICKNKTVTRNGRNSLMVWSIKLPQQIYITVFDTATKEAPSWCMLGSSIVPPTSAHLSLGAFFNFTTAVFLGVLFWILNSRSRRRFGGHPSTDPRSQISTQKHYDYMSDEALTGLTPTFYLNCCSHMLQEEV